MTTAIDFEVRDRETNDRLTVTDVESALADRQRTGWVPNPSYRHPTTSPDTPPPDVDPVPLHHDGRPLEHVRLPRRNGHEVPAYGYGRLVGQSTLTPNRTAVRDVRLHQEVGYEHMQQQAQDWRDLEWDAAQVKHLPPVTVSDEYRANRDVLERLYARDLQAILDGGAPLPAQHPARELAPAKLDADAQRRRKALAAAAQREPALQPETEDQPGWKRPTWLTRLFDAVFPLRPEQERRVA